MTMFHWPTRLATAALAFSVVALTPPARASIAIPDAPFPTTSFTLGAQNGDMYSVTGRAAIKIRDENDGILGATPPATRNVYAGGFALFGQGDASSVGNFLAWCLDILNSYNANASYTATLEPALPDNGAPDARGREGDIKRLFDTAYDGLLGNWTSAKAAAFQIALWEIVYEDGGSPYDISDGDFRATNQPTIRGIAQGFLDDVNEAVAGTGNYQITYLETDNGQDLVTVSPVPLPAAGLLMLGALGGGAVVYRRRKTV